MILLLQNSKPNHIHTDQSDIWLNTVSFENENILISAPSGTGKTSIFNILYLNDNHFEGSYLIDGITSNELDDTAISNLRTNGISAIFQDLKLF
jgi:putative ABC transport system ATP-binding protein